MNISCVECVYHNKSTTIKCRLCDDMFCTHLVDKLFSLCTTCITLIFKKKTKVKIPFSEASKFLLLQ